MLREILFSNTLILIFSTRLHCQVPPLTPHCWAQLSWHEAWGGSQYSYCELKIRVVLRGSAEFSNPWLLINILQISKTSRWLIARSAASLFSSSPPLPPSLVDPFLSLFFLHITTSQNRSLFLSHFLLRRLRMQFTILPFSSSTLDRHEVLPLPQRRRRRRIHLHF